MGNILLSFYLYLKINDNVILTSVFDGAVMHKLDDRIP